MDIRDRVRRLRARIGAPPAVGSDLEKRPLTDHRYWKDVWELRRLEAKLVELTQRDIDYWAKRAGYGRRKTGRDLPRLGEGRRLSKDRPDL